MTALMTDRPKAIGTGSEFRRWNDPVDTTWHHQAACYEAGELERRLFEPLGLDEAKPDAWRRAAYGIDMYCAFCPVRAKCAKEGADHLYEGVWGGQFRERRGVIDTDTGMVLRSGEELELVAGGEAVAAATEDPLVEPTPINLDALLAFPTVTDRRGQEQFALIVL